METTETERDDTETVDTETVDTAEPATSHDVAEGGLLGAVGGAVVGLLAGGPLGAVIGAVIGGVASAGAVDVVDKHDHDSARTTDGSDTAPPVDDTASPLDDVVVPASEALAPVTPIDVVTPPYLDIPADVVTPVDFGAETTDLTTAIRARAYEIYELRGRGEGRDVEDWLAAEQEISPV